MFKIYKINESPVVDFAAEELKKISSYDDARLWQKNFARCPR